MKMIVSTALTEVPVNVMPLVSDSDFKTVQESVAYNAGGMDLVWNFVTTGGAFTQTAVTPTTGGVYDWTNQGNGMYSIEIPASGGGTINNNANGYGWFTGVATGVLPWRGPVIEFVSANVANTLVNGTEVLWANVTQWGFTNIATPDTAGYPKVTIKSGTGTGEVSLTSGVAAASVSSMGTGVITAASIAADAITDAKVASDVTIASVTGSVGSVTGAVGSVTAGVTLANDAITAAKFDESTAFPLTSADTSTTRVARTGADSDTLETISDQIDGISVGANPNVILTAEIATLSSQTSFTLATGATHNDAYNGQAIVLYDDSNSDYPSVRTVSDYVGATKTVTLSSAPDFTLGTDDSVAIFATAPGSTGASVADIWGADSTDYAAGTMGGDVMKNTDTIVLSEESAEDLADIIGTELQGLMGTTQPRINQPPDPGFTTQVSRRSDGTYKCTKPIRITSGAITQVFAFIDMSPLFGTNNLVETVGTPTVSGGSVTASAEGPRDTYAVVELDGTATAGEERTVTVPVTMSSGTQVDVVFDLEVFD